MFDLKTVNPGLYQNWQAVQGAPPEFHSPPDPVAVKELEILSGGRLPDDYKSFLLQYGSVGGSITTDVMYFHCQYPSKEFIDSDFGLVSGARHTIKSTKILSQPHLTLEGVGPRIPENMIATNIDNYCTFLIDLRSESFGHMYYIANLKKKTFGTTGYDWDSVAFVGQTFTAFIAGVGTKNELTARYPNTRVK